MTLQLPTIRAQNMLDKNLPFFTSLPSGESMLRTKLVTALAAGLLAPTVALAGPMIPVSGGSLSPHDDSGVNAQLNFNIKFFDVSTSQVTVGSNGYVSFGGSPNVQDVLQMGHDTFIAPFLGDIDLAHNNTTAAISYGNILFEGRQAFAVSWTDVSYRPYSYPYYLSNYPVNFQLLLVDRSNQGAAGDFDFIFNYDSMQTEVSHSPNNPNGFFVGYGSKGDIYGDDTTWNYHLTKYSNLLVNRSTNSDVSGRHVFEVRNGVVINPLEYNYRYSPLSPVPEPETWAMMLVGLGLMAKVAARRRA
jgi:hypothetical protein